VRRRPAGRFRGLDRARARAGRWDDGSAGPREGSSTQTQCLRGANGCKTAVRWSVDGGGCVPTGRHYACTAAMLRVAAVGAGGGWAAEASMNELTLVCIDTETTGRDPAVDRVIEIGCVFYEGGQVVRRKSWLLNPECPIPQEASSVHGITDA